MRDFAQDFPALSKPVYGRRLIYMDNAATTQIPVPVIERLKSHYENDHGNVFRGSHYLSRKSTEAMEQARRHAARFLNAATPENIVFTSGATESINMAAWGLRAAIAPGDEIIVSALEHHSNFVPWQQLCFEKKAAFKVIPLKDGRFDMAAFEAMLNPRVRLVAVTEVSNLTGEALPVSAIIKKAHEYGSLVCVDGAQGVRHSFGIPEDCDFYCISAHKMFGPGGVGILYGKQECLNMLKPVKTGGGMVLSVDCENTEFAPLPYRLEAGTPDFPAIIAFDETLDYIESVGIPTILEQEQRLSASLTKELLGMKGIFVAGGHMDHHGIISFEADGADAYDLGVMLDLLGVAVRTGNHCAQPAMKALGKDTLVRASLAFYNTQEDIDGFLERLETAICRCQRPSRKNT